MTRHGDDEECCDMRGMLGYLILFSLSKKPMHGQDELAKRRGDIYPALKGLKDSGFLGEEEKIGKTTTYMPRGMKAFQVAKRRFTRIFLGVLG